MQALPHNVLRRVSNLLPARNVRRMERAFSHAPGVAAAARESLLARKPLNRKLERATLALVKRNRDIMAIVTRVVHMLEAGRLEGTVSSRFFPPVSGELRSFAFWPYVRMTIKLRVRTSTTPVRGSEMEMTYTFHEARQARLWEKSLSGKQPTSERRIAFRAVNLAIAKALHANGYTVIAGMIPV